MEYELKESSPELVTSLMEKFGLDSLSATILARRGAEEKDMVWFFEEDIVFQHSPFLFLDSLDAVERIEEAIEGGENIAVYGDRDCDGITSTAILVKELKRMGAGNLSYRLPLGDEPYGLTDELVDEFIKNGITLLITVDNGISALNQIRALRNNGIDTIVLDHHLPGDEFPPAYAILDPKVEGSGYPFSDPAACLVAFKTMYALRFLRSPLYGSECILLHASPENESVRIDAYRLENLEVTSRISEVISLSSGYDISRSSLLKFLSCSLPVIVLDRDVELKLLRKAFGNKVDIVLEELRPRIEKLIPRIKGKSLYDLSLVSRVVRYSDGNSEMETLLSLFRSYSLYGTKGLMDGLDELVQLVAIGTIADMMKLENENRLFVKMGLKRMSQKPLKSLSYILSKLGLFGRNIHARDISYNLSPLINSSGRMGKPDVALSLLLSDDEGDIERISEELIALNKERQRSTDESISLTEEIAESSYEHFAHRFLIVSDPSIPRGLTGNLASRFLNKFKVPSVVLAYTEDGKMVASIRSGKNFNAKEFLSLFSSHFLYYGGHGAAAGFTIEKDEYPKFLSSLEDVVYTYEEGGEDEHLVIDSILPERMLSDSLWSIRERFEPFGQGNPPLLFLLENVRIREIYPNRNGASYLRFSVEANDEIWPCVFWENDKSEGYFKPQEMVDLVFSPEINYYKGIDHKQLMIKAMEKSIDSQGVFLR